MEGGRRGRCAHARDRLLSSLRSGRQGTGRRGWFEDGKGTRLRGDRGNPSGAERGHGAETVVNEIEAVGNAVEVRAGIQKKGVGLERDEHSVDAGKSEAH